MMYIKDICLNFYTKIYRMIFSKCQWQSLIFIDLALRVND